jgi:BirA family biotin operon repressor/biotin-[acetyl-CoA-carboxylase] ligase
MALAGFATALAISDAIETYVGEARTTLKWPNDVFLDGAKCAGILIESGGAWFSLSLGANLAVSPKMLDQPTTSVAEALGDAAPSPGDFFGLLRPKLEAWLARLAADGFAPLRDAWLARAHGLGAQARVVLGEETVLGRLSGLSERGELELDTSAGRRLIAAGDVLLTAV